MTLLLETWRISQQNASGGRSSRSCCNVEVHLQPLDHNKLKRCLVAKLWKGLLWVTTKSLKQVRTKRPISPWSTESFLHQLLHQLLKGIVGNFSSSSTLPNMCELWRPFLSCFKPQIDCDWTLSTQVMQSITTPAVRKKNNSSSHKLLSLILLRILFVGRLDRTNGLAWVSFEFLMC